MPRFLTIMILAAALTRCSSAGDKPEKNVFDDYLRRKYGVRGQTAQIPAAIPEMPLPEAPAEQQITAAAFPDFHYFTALSDGAQAILTKTMIEDDLRNALVEVGADYPEVAIAAVGLEGCKLKEYGEMWIYGCPGSFSFQVEIAGTRADGTIASGDERVEFDSVERAEFQARLAETVGRVLETNADLM